MYEELVKALRYCVTSPDGFTDCNGCPKQGHSFDCEDELHKDAAAAIEELQAEVAELKRVNMEIFDDLPKRGEWIKHPEVKNIY